MTGPRYRLTESADADIEGILRYTSQRFGPVQHDRYAQLIEKAVTMAAATPEHPSSRARNELGRGVRSLHLERVAKRLGAASHVLFYRAGPPGSDVIILRVLHDAMELVRHVREPFD